MQVVLLKDVPKVGKKYDAKDVSDGYGRNFLLRNGLAELATPKSLKMAGDMRSKVVAEKKMEEVEIEAGLAKLSGAKVVLKGRANEEGHLFAGIKTEEISLSLKEQTGLLVSPDYIKLDKPIKMVGEHQVLVIVGNKKAPLKVLVEKE